MLKKIIFPAILLPLFITFGACNKSDSEEYTYEQSSSVLISGFSLNSNKNVLDSLENVFFSIDLVNARIFNADSLPYGTDVSRLVPKISAPSTASEVTLTFYEPSLKRDSVINYLKNSTDSVNFSAGPVKLTVKSQNGAVSRDYEIKVNVHKVKSDSLCWYQMQSAQLPTTFGKLKAQCTAYLDGEFMCLSTDGSSYCLAKTSTPDSPDWTTSDIVFPFTPDVESLRYSSDAVYMLSVDGELYKSSNFADWVSTGQNWKYIYGGYNEQILGSRNDGDHFTIVSYPSGKEWVAPLDFPVENTSVPSFYKLPMGYSSQIVMLGGRKADGSLVNGAWSFDGENWAMVSKTLLPVALEDITLVPYRLSEMLPTNWSPFSYPVLLAMGGRADSGAVNRTVYYSRDWGMTWRKGQDVIQLPSTLPAFYKAMAYTYTSKMYVDSRSSYWQPLEIRKIQPGTSYMLPFNESSRAVTPVTEWECPAVYVFGGRNPDGETLNMLWRGVITEFTFVPVE